MMMNGLSLRLNPLFVYVQSHTYGHEDRQQVSYDEGPQKRPNIFAHGTVCNTSKV